MKQYRKTSRRRFVAEIVAGTIGTTCLAPSMPALAAESRSLKALAAEKGILFGSSVGAGNAGTLTGSFVDAKYTNILKQECSVLVPENELKSYVIATEPERYNFQPADRIASFARDNGIKLRGHTLLWNRNEFTPKWLQESFGVLDRGGAEKYLRGYIQRVCTHYRDRIFSWDVVNETIDPKTGEIRQTPFTRVLGFDALRIAYEAAREHAAPRTQLVYNDYMSWETGNETHRAGVLRLLEEFRKRNVPVDALGIQSHIGNDGHIQAAQRKEWRDFVEDAVAMGYQLLITELDVNDKDLPTAIPARDAQAAAAAREYLDLMLSFEQLDQVLCWGMVDKYSWLQNFSPRDDKLPQRPCPYDETFKPKPLREAIASAFQSAPRRTGRA
jgi:endo-1,4-beta-xylanase